MKTYFADTSLFVAFLNARDEFHDAAVTYLSLPSNQMVTTDWVVVELGNFVSKWPARRRFVPFVRDLRDDSSSEIIPSARDVLDAALDLYRRRPDKHWSMTDCTSFVCLPLHNLANTIASTRLERSR
jgi:predicted nucleic acid-binding protein